MWNRVDEDALMRSVIDDAWDPIPRGVIADWWQENVTTGEEHYAKQLELYRLQSTKLSKWESKRRARQRLVSLAKDVHLSSFLSDPYLVRLTHGRVIGFNGRDWVGVEYSEPGSMRLVGSDTSSVSEMIVGIFEKREFDVHIWYRLGFPHRAYLDYGISFLVGNIVYVKIVKRIAMHLFTNEPIKEFISPLSSGFFRITLQYSRTRKAWLLSCKSDHLQIADQSRIEYQTRSAAIEALFTVGCIFELVYEMHLDAQLAYERLHQPLEMASSVNAFVRARLLEENFTRRSLGVDYASMEMEMRVTELIAGNENIPPNFQITERNPNETKEEKETCGSSEPGAASTDVKST